MKLKPRPFLPMQALGLLLALCAALTPAITQAQTPSKKLYVFVSPDRLGVNTFLQQGKSGVEAAAKKHGAAVKTLESSNASDRAENVRAALSDGATLVVLLGFEFADIVEELAPKSPKTQFLIVDQCIKKPPANVSCATFREQESAYLLGATAALFAKTQRIGVVAALDIPFLRRYTEAYAQGARMAKPGIAVDVRYVGGPNPFGDPVRAKEQALALRAAGSESIFTATSGGDFGVFDAARAQGFQVLSVDSNRCPNVPGLGLDNTLKQVDRVVQQSIDLIEGGGPAQQRSYGLKEGGMGLMALDVAGLPQSGCLVATRPDVVQKIRAWAQDIISGKLVIEDPMTRKR